MPSKKARLFLGVEENYDMSVKIAYRRDDQEEAREFINAMPKILEYNLGDNIWDWFDTFTRDMLEGYICTLTHLIHTILTHIHTLHIHKNPYKLPSLPYINLHYRTITHKKKHKILATQSLQKTLIQ